MSDRIQKRTRREIVLRDGRCLSGLLHSLTLRAEIVPRTRRCRQPHSCGAVRRRRRSIACAASSAIRSIWSSRRGRPSSASAREISKGWRFFGQDNHLFLKPKAAKVATNLTVLTSRRHYQFDYTALAQRPAADDPDVIFALRFTYPPAAVAVAAEPRRRSASIPHSENASAQTTAKHRLLVLRRARRCARSPPRTTACIRGCALRRMRICRRFSCATTTAASRCSTSAWTRATSSCIGWRTNSFCGAASSPDASSTRDSAAAALRLDSGTVTPEVERTGAGSRAMNDRGTGRRIRCRASATPRPSIAPFGAVAHQQCAGHRAHEHPRFGIAHLVLRACDRRGRARARQSAQSVCASRAQGRYGAARAWAGSIRRSDPPLDRRTSRRLDSERAAEIPLGDRLAARRDPAARRSRPSGAYGAPPPKTAAQLTLERQLSGAGVRIAKRCCKRRRRGAACRRRACARVIGRQ